jgi:beta-lactamase superfamily II metal-dependent hydrolase
MPSVKALPSETTPKRATAAARKRNPAAAKRPVGSTKKTNQKLSKLGNGQLTVRMYNVGFGDAFLFTIPTSDGDRRVLVDCGQHIGGKITPLRQVIDDIVATCTVKGKTRIDVIVATHRHYDHIAGFDDPAWANVEVGEVWMPWTEERGVASADRLRHKQHRLATALQAHMGANSGGAMLVLNAMSNKNAEKELLNGFAGNPTRRYLPLDDITKRTFTTKVLPGVKVHVLGPSRSPETIALLDPPPAERFQVASFRTRPGVSDQSNDTETAAETSPKPGDVAPLFAERYRMDRASGLAAFPGLRDAPNKADDLLKAIAKKSTPDFFGAASRLDNAINGTSLVLVLEVAGHVLLLGGDAEWGTWSEILADTTWRELLQRTTLYKVSHHGSFNGTPQSFVNELLPKNALSIVSLTAVKNWPSKTEPGRQRFYGETGR